MTKVDEATLYEWLDLDLEGQLGAAEQAELESWLAQSPAARRERQALCSLHEALAEAREPVEDGFRQRVVAALPATGWEARPLRNWGAMIALFVCLGGGAAAIVGSSAAGLAPSSAFGTALLAVVDLFAAGMVTGAGMLGASWKGLGLALGEWLQLSWGGLVTFGIIVACLNIQLYRMTRRRRRLAPAAQRELERRSRSDD